MPRFVPNSGTLWRIPALERIGIRVLTLQRFSSEARDRGRKLGVRDRVTLGSEFGVEMSYLGEGGERGKEEA